MLTQQSNTQIGGKFAFRAPEATRGTRVGPRGGINGAQKRREGKAPEEIEQAEQKAAVMRAARMGDREIDSEAEFPYEDKAIPPGKPR